MPHLGIPAYLASTRLRRLELLGGLDQPAASANRETLQQQQQQQDGHVPDSLLASLLLRLPLLHTLALRMPRLCGSEWAVLSALCSSRQLMELKLNPWKSADAVPRCTGGGSAAPAGCQLLVLVAFCTCTMCPDSSIPR